MIFSRSVHIVANGSISSFLLAAWYSIVYMDHIFFMKSSIQGYFGCFHVSATVNNALFVTVLCLTESVDRVHSCNCIHLACWLEAGPTCIAGLAGPVSLCCAFTPASAQHEDSRAEIQEGKSPVCGTLSELCLLSLLMAHWPRQITRPRSE
uniref:Uncharacterized protein n=1 Tax=Myotis myotis TaxID=51298 RepID=A0A7J7U5K1_MYOMY|nr:hypothetical protein mMyoMyo1_008889 [Myotis myotis]